MAADEIRPEIVMKDSAELASLIDRLPGARVLCCGDIMLDRYVYGVVDRVSPEAPIPVVRVKHENAMLGGVGNVARNIAALGGEAVLVAVAGNDIPGHSLQALIADEAGLTGRIVVDLSRTTTVKTRYVAGGQQLMRADMETGGALADSVVAELLRVFETALAEADGVVFSDYAKGVLGDEFLKKAITMTRSAGKPLVVDPKGVPFSRYRGASLLTPNRKELGIAATVTGDDDESITTATQDLLAECGVEAVLVTRSERGMSLIEPGSAPLHLPARAREVFDVSGAGDTVAATITLALAAGASLADGARLANLAASLVVGKVGTAVIAAGELREALFMAEVLNTEAKVAALPQVLESVERWRQRGLKVGFTNGCFDLVHPGHISLLNQARAACDRLVVGLNSDSSVRQLKGEDRPVQNETARATVLASLSMVDQVVLFAEDTPMRLIEAIRPDVLVKGADYSVDQVVGADVVQAYGGRVVLAKLKDGHSTTGTIAKLVG